MDTPTDDPNPHDPTAASRLPAPPTSAPGDRPRVTLGPDGAVVVPTSGSPPGLPPEAAPTPTGSFWQRIPKKFIVIGVIVAVLAGVGWWNGRGKTDAVDLEAGDCFEQPDLTSDVSDVTTQSCAGSHETEIYAVVTLSASDPYPGDVAVSSDPTPADLACTAAVEELEINFDNIPTDLENGYFFPARSEWDDGDRSLLCYATSPTGIPGPLVKR